MPHPQPSPTLVKRQAPADVVGRLTHAGLSPLMARIYAGRGVTHPDEASFALNQLLAPATLLNIEHAATVLADAIARQLRLLIVADYDCDGATACAIGIRGIRAMGGTVDFLVPNRFTLGYGLTPEVVRLAALHPAGKPDILITVDNGIASVDGVDEALRLGMATVVTDHHLPGRDLPRAETIVNPNQLGDSFASKALAGCGVMYYVLMATRAELRRRGWFVGARPEPNLASLLDLVALGTVADVVALDPNNRILVHSGLERIRTGRAQAGVAALFHVAGRPCERATSQDLAFSIGPRLNAAGRIADMSVGIRCLICDDPTQAAALASTLDAMNRERREIETSMRDDALASCAATITDVQRSICLYDPAWHQGVIGLVASRLKEAHFLPTFALAPDGDPGDAHRAESDFVKGSGRSIPGFHLRDALDLVSKRHPALLVKFGGHAMAAGLTLRRSDVDVFRRALEEVASEMIDEAMLSRQILTDGPLDPALRSLPTARALELLPWGQGFLAPVFADTFVVEQQRTIKDKHLKLRVRDGGRPIEAMLFNQVGPLPDRIDAAYRLAVNEYQDSFAPQLVIEHWSEAAR